MDNSTTSAWLLKTLSFPQLTTDHVQLVSWLVVGANQKGEIKFEFNILFPAIGNSNFFAK